MPEFMKMFSKERKDEIIFNMIGLMECRTYGELAKFAKYFDKMVFEDYDNYRELMTYCKSL